MPHSIASLHLNYALEDHCTVLRHAHSGPLRVLKSLYPEGKGICHNILIHPPSGLVGGDLLDVQIQVAQGAHALITTPGAARFFASKEHTAKQKTRAVLSKHARLEWLPMETLAYSGCLGANETIFELAEESMLIARDVLSLGLPHAHQAFLAGQFSQHLEVSHHWLDKGLIQASDQRLLNSALGLNGKSCVASMVLASGTPLDKVIKDRAIDLARELCHSQKEGINMGVSSPSEHLIVVRSLSDQVEPCMQVFQKIRMAWRTEVWQTATNTPRIWHT